MQRTSHSDAPLRVFKFGGASVKDSAGLRNVANIIAAESTNGGKLIVVVSAMGKTTNALEAILEAGTAGLEYHTLITELMDLHRKAAGDALTHPNQMADLLDSYERELVRLAEQSQDTPFDEAYDQLVSLGEVISAEMLTAVLKEHSVGVELWDARKLVRTDSNFRAPIVDFEVTQAHIMKQALDWTQPVAVVQGFVGGDEEGRTTTLGREGSDYTAALFGRSLKVESVTVWKDVPGVLNADPKRLSNARLLSNLSYASAAEMTFYGATVLHPKTLKPLAEADIPLYVRSFLNPSESGTRIGTGDQAGQGIDIYIYLPKVALISCRALDLSFVTEEHLAEIIDAAHQVGLRVLLLQSSALELQLVVMQDFHRAAQFATKLEEVFEVQSRYDLALATFIRADANFVQTIHGHSNILLRQLTADRELLLMAV